MRAMLYSGRKGGGKRKNVREMKVRKKKKDYFSRPLQRLMH
jgi:hypothetical protein